MGKEIGPASGGPALGRIPEPWRAAAPPMILSLLLSALTVGVHPQWQDSTLYLTAVREYGVLYPPGFVLYLTLCKGWTLLLEPIAGFTLAVHLFSSACAAAAAGATGLAAWTASRHATASAAAGCLAASGYTWWFSGLYAKGYALYVLIVALLLWRLLRKDHRTALLLLGLAWAAHPSAALLLPAAAFHAWSCRAEILQLGARRWAVAGGLAVLCAFGPALLLPAISARETPFAMGHVASLGRLAEYAVGKRFVEIPGVWGVVPERLLAMLGYVWEEFLGVGLACVALGVATLRKEAPGRLAGLAVWTGSVGVVTALFKIEGQHDLWLLAAYVPLFATAAVGLAALARRWAPAPAVLGAAGVLWAVAANYADVEQRRYDLVDRFGEALLKPLPPDAVVILRSDDTLGVCSYMQAVRRERRDVLVVSASFLSSSDGAGWYLERLRARRPDLRAPDERPPDPSTAASLAGAPQTVLASAALANANAREGCAVFFETPPPAAAIRKDSVVVRSGLLWKMVPRGEAEAVEPSSATLPVSAEEVAGRMRRSRGQWVRISPGTVRVGPEPYEWRFLKPLLELRLVDAERQLRLRSPEGFARAVSLYDSVLRMDRDEVFGGRAAFLYGSALVATGDRRRAALAFESALEKGGLQPAHEAGAWLQRGELHRADGRPELARACFERAAAVIGVDAALRAEIDRRLNR
jgi:tetratricopeptide (TPR) repeat protein